MTVPSKTVHLSFLQTIQRTVRPLWMAFTQASAQTKCLVLCSFSQGIYVLICLDSKLEPSNGTGFRGRKFFLQKIPLRIKFSLNFIQNVSA